MVPGNKFSKNQIGWPVNKINICFTLETLKERGRDFSMVAIDLIIHYTLGE